ncbi:MAG: SGNH/GDSL hydrolase family protein, partial [Candidatus Omnitrophica bacterium]|nr:SGNH/GDSL hydrolase family protein [Candidatus Omnitrophota bacterium]
CILVKDIEDPLLQIVKDRREYILKPNSEFTLKNGIVYKINSKGLRDREFDYKSDKYRILAVGDSTTFGWEESLENTYPKLLENILKCEVINAGVYDYNIEHEYGFLKIEGIKYNPDLVILGFYINDAQPASSILINPRWEMERVKSWLLELIKDRLNILFKKDIFTLGRVGSSCHEWENFGWRKKRCFKTLKNIKEFLDKNEVELLVIIFPSFRYQKEKIAPYSEYAHFKIINDSVKDFCMKENIRVLDLYVLFEGKIASDVSQASGEHLNRNGNLIVAKALAQYIKNNFKLE